VFNTQLFKECFYRNPANQELAQQKIIPISGDIAVKGLGINQETVEKLKKEVNVVISCAASINFTDPLI